MRKLITTDSHWAPPISLADELTPAYRDYVAHFEERSDGTYLIQPRKLDIPDGHPLKEMMTALGGAALKVDPAAAYEMVSAACPGSHPHADPKGRLQEMKRDGVLAEVLIGPEGFGHNMPGDVDLAWCRLMNDWLAENYRDYMHCFAPSIQVPLGAGMKAAAAEIERAAGLGLRPILLPDCLPGCRITSPIGSRFGRSPKRSRYR